MSWTSLPGQKTTTSREGRNPELTGLPLDGLRLAAEEDAVAFAARAALNSPGNIRLAKQYLKKALQLQLEEEKFAIVEFLSPCPTDWNMTPVNALRWIEEEVVRYYPPGILKDRSRGEIQ